MTQLGWVSLVLRVLVSGILLGGGLSPKVRMISGESSNFAVST